VEITSHVRFHLLQAAHDKYAIRKQPTKKCGNLGRTPSPGPTINGEGALSPNLVIFQRFWNDDWKKLRSVNAQSSPLFPAVPVIGVENTCVG